MKIHLTLPLALAATPGCSDTEAAAPQEWEQAWSELRDYGAEQKEAFAAEAEARLERLAGSIGELRTGVSGAARSGADEIADARAEIDRRVRELRDEIADLGEQTQEGWNAARDRVVERLRALEELVAKRSS